MGPRTRLSVVQSRHGAAGRTGAPPARACLASRRELRVPLWRALLQLRWPAPLQSEIRAGVGAQIPGGARRTVAAARSGRCLGADRRRYERAVRTMIRAITCVLLLMALSTTDSLAQPPPAPIKMPAGRFGTVTVYKPKGMAQ